MPTLKRYRMSLITLIFFLTACSTSSLASSLPSPAQMLQNSANAMSQLKSAHIDFQANLNIQVVTTTPTNSNANGLAFDVTGHSDVAAPDKVSLDLSLGQTPLFSLRVIGQKVYAHGKDGSWLLLDKSQVKDGVQNFFSQSLTQRTAQIMAMLQNAKLTDHGQESLNGKTLEHLTVTLDQQSLKALSEQLNGMLSTDLQSGQNQLQQATLDLWIDQSTWYVHQAKLDVVTHVDGSKIPMLAEQQGNGSAAIVPVELKIQVNFSKFNEPVDIQAPANAVTAP